MNGKIGLRKRQRGFSDKYKKKSKEYDNTQNAGTEKKNTRTSNANTGTCNALARPIIINYKIQRIIMKKDKRR